MMKGYRATVFLLLLLLTYPFSAQGQSVETFSYTGSMQSWVVPLGVTEVAIEVWGAEGADAVDRLPGNGGGGLGGYASGKLTVTPGETLYIYVGGEGNTDGTGGFNGGGAGGFGAAGSSCSGGNAGGGGGASDIRQGGTVLTDRVIVAAGGGGGGRDYCNGTCQPCGCGGSGGGGGGLLGDNGTSAFNCGYGYAGNGINFGLGATQLTGGTGGPADNGGSNTGTNGTLGQGGVGSDGLYDVAGGGGGGGYYGGGGGGGASNGSGVGAGGAGGGTSYIEGLVDGTTLSDVREGNGEIRITYSVLANPMSIPTLGQWTLFLLIISLATIMGVGVKSTRSCNK